MPTYENFCDNCEYTFESQQGYHDEPLVTCPECNEDSLRRIYSLSHIGGGEVKTLGSLADQNSKTLGTYFKESEKQKWIEGKLASSKFMGGIPDSAAVAERKEYNPPWRTGPIDKSLATLSDEKKEKFILTGKK